LKTEVNPFSVPWTRTRFPLLLNGVWKKFLVCAQFSLNKPIFPNASLTHTSRPYCDLKTSKIAFFFRKSFGFLSNFSRRRSGALQSCVHYGFSMSSIRPFYVHGVSTATILRPQGVFTTIIGDPDATVLRSLRPYGDSTATIAFVRRLSCDCTTTLLRPCYVYKNNTFTINYGVLSTSVLRLLRSYCVLTTMLLRLWRLHCDPEAT